jgi:peptide/nickel transport system permease protein
MAVGDTAPALRESVQPLVTPTSAPQGYWAGSWSRLRRDRIALGAGTILILYSLIAVSAPLWPVYVTGLTPERQNLDALFAPPLSPPHWLGTDELGRDTLTRLVFGARVSLLVGFLAVAIALLIGSVLGLIAGFYGGLIEDMVMRLVDLLLSIPTIYLLIFITSLLPLAFGDPAEPLLVLRHDALSLALVLAVTGWAPLARLVRAEVQAVTHRDFILAARSVGAGDIRLMIRHVLPNVLPVMIVTASLGVGFAILAEASLDFIGLGVRPPTPSWGNMLSGAQTYFYESGVLVVLPGLAIVTTVVSANVLGNAIRDAFDPRV